MTSASRDMVRSPVLLFVGLPALTAWGTLAGLGVLAPDASLCFAPRASMATSVESTIDATLAFLSPADVLQTAALMTAAMAVPLAANSALHVHARSFVRHRAAAVAIFVLALSTIWVVMLGPLIVVGMTAKAALSVLLPAPILGAMAPLAVAAHRASREYASALTKCHRAEAIRPFPPAFATDVARFGARSAMSCARLCWPAMLLPWFSSRALIAMALATFLTFADRHAHRASAQPSIIVLTLFALIELMTLA